MENKELTIIRTFNAPLELVWEAWTDKKHIEQWFGPTGFTIPVCDWNAQKGNKIYVEMKAPDGAIYPMDGEFIEILKPKKIVFKSAALNKKGEHLFEILNTIIFAAEENKTKLTLSFIASNITEEGVPYISGMEEGWNLTLDKLSSYVSGKMK